MVAGSQLPVTGNLPLPSQNGPARKFVDFGAHPDSFGQGRTPAQTAPARQSSARPASSAAAMADLTPSAITHVHPAPSAPATARFTPIPKPVPTPTLSSNTLALGTPTPFSTPVVEIARLNTPPPLRVHSDLPPGEHTPASPPSSQPSMQREAEKTRVQGGIATPGRPGVDAVQTPLGRYHDKLFNLIGSRWRLYIREHPQGEVGDLTIKVTLDSSGKVLSTHIYDNHSVGDLAAISTRAIVESDFPPVPDDLAPMLRDGKLEMSFSFSVYDSSNDLPGR
jgi:hypothetical protein